MVLTTYHDTNSGHDMLSFSYQQVSLTTTPQKADGSLGTPVTFSWDLATAKEGPNIPDPVANHAPVAIDDSCRGHHRYRRHGNWKCARKR